MNIAALLSVLRLEDIKFTIATDFKLLNMLLGLSVCYDDKIQKSLRSVEQKNFELIFCVSSTQLQKGAAFFFICVV